MFSKSESDLINGYAKLAALLCIVRADWDEKTQLFKETKSKFKIIGNYVIIATPWLFTAWGLWRMEKVFLSKSYNCNDLFKIFFIFMVIEYAVYLFFRVAFTSSNASLIMLFNQMQTFVRNSKDKNRGDHKIRSKRLMIYQRMYIATGIFNNGTICIVDAIYMWNITPNNIWLSIWIAMMLHFLMWAAFILIGLVQMYMFLYFGIITSTFSSSKITSTGFTPAVANQMITEYFGLTILANNFNQTYCKLIVPGIKYVVGLMAMICVLIAIRVRNTDSPGASLQSIAYLIMATYFFAIVVVGAHLMSEVWQKSNIFLEEFSTAISSLPTSSEQMKTYLNHKITSLHPIRFGVGGMYYMEKEAKLTLIDALVDGTATLLLTFDN